MLYECGHHTRKVLQHASLCFIPYLSVVKCLMLKKKKSESDLIKKDAVADFSLYVGGVQSSEAG